MVEEGEEGGVEGEGELIFRGDGRRERGHTVTNQTGQEPVIGSCSRGLDDSHKSG